MKNKFLAFCLALCSLTALAGPNDITTDQRNGTDTAYVRRFYPTPTDGTHRIQYFNGQTLLPGYLSLGPGLAITGTVLNTTGGGSGTQVNSDWNATSGAALILNKPTLFSGNYVDLTNKPTLFSGNYADLANRPTLFSGNYVDLVGKPTIPAAQVNADWDAISGVTAILNKPVLFSGSYADLTDKPTFSNVAVTGSYDDLYNRPTLFSGSYTDLTNKPNIPAAQVNADWNSSTGVSAILNKPTLFSGNYVDLADKPVLFSGAYADLTGKPTIPAAQVNADWNAVSGVSLILNKPALFSGSYTDLTNKPTIPAAQVNSDWNVSTGVAAIQNKPVLATVATSGSYNDLSNKPTIPTVTAFNYGSPNARSITVGTAYQATNTTKAANLTITLSCPTTLTISGGTTCTGEVRIGPTAASVAAGGSGGFAVGPYSNSLTGTLVVGVTINSSNFETKTISLPAGWYFSVLQNSGSGLTVQAAFDQSAS